MIQIETELIINAPIQRVWEILTDFDKHQRWNPFIKSISGQKEVGKKIKVTLHPPGSKIMTFSPRILVLKKEKELRWKGQLFIPGLFDGEHYFLLEELDESTTLFIHGEKFSGILLGIIKKTLSKTHIGFEMMNKSLKLLCEKDRAIRELERNLTTK